MAHDEVIEVSSTEHTMQVSVGTPYVSFAFRIPLPMADRVADAMKRHKREPEPPKPAFGVHAGGKVQE
jgi:hypothetical protein